MIIRAISAPYNHGFVSAACRRTMVAATSAGPQTHTFNGFSLRDEQRSLFWVWRLSVPASHWKILHIFVHIIIPDSVFPPWQLLRQSSCGLRCWQFLWVLRWCWNVRCLVTLCRPSAGWREATPNRLEARSRWGKLQRSDFTENVKHEQFLHSTWQHSSVSRRQRNATLHIQSVRSYDEGVYVCEASNALGRSHSTALLRVAGKFETFLPPRTISESLQSQDQAAEASCCDGRQVFWQVFLRWGFLTSLLYASVLEVIQTSYKLEMKGYGGGGGSPLGIQPFKCDQKSLDMKLQFYLTFAQIVCVLKVRNASCSQNLTS